MYRNGPMVLNSYINLLQNELRNLRLQNLATDPAGAVAGQAYYNTGTNRLRVYSGTAWIELGTTGVIADGTVTSAKIADDTILNIDVNAAAAILMSKTADDTGAAGRLALTNAERTKLTGIATAATANSSDATLLARANHTGLQTSATISDFNTAADARAQAKIDALVAAAPAALDTLNELAASLGNDANFSTTVNTALALRTKRYTQTFGDGTAVSFTINHGLALTTPQAITVSIYVVATGVMELCEVTVVDANNVTLSGFNPAPAANSYRVMIVG